MSLLDKFKNLTSSKPNEKDLFKSRKLETINKNVGNIPTFSKLTSDKQLYCTLCKIIIKNEVAWLKHSKLEQHISVLKSLKDKSNSQNQQINIEQNLQSIHVSNNENFLEIKDNKSDSIIYEDKHQEQQSNSLKNIMQEEFQHNLKDNKLINQIISRDKNKILLSLSEKNENKNELPEGFFDSKNDIAGSIKTSENQTLLHSNNIVIQTISNTSNIKNERNYNTLKSEQASTENSGLFFDKNNQISSNLSQQIFHEEDINDDNIDKEIEEMIECTDFIENLISKKSKGKKIQAQKNFKNSVQYQYLLQKEEIFSENLNTNFLKRKRVLDISKLNPLDSSDIKNTAVIHKDGKSEELEINDLFDLDWRKQN